MLILTKNLAFNIFRFLKLSYAFVLIHGKYIVYQILVFEKYLYMYIIYIYILYIYIYIYSAISKDLSVHMFYCVLIRTEQFFSENLPEIFWYCHDNQRQTEEIPDFLDRGWRHCLGCFFRFCISFFFLSSSIS